MAWSLVSQPNVNVGVAKKPVICVLMPQEESMSVEFIERTWAPLKAPSQWCDKQYMMCRVPSLPLARNILVQQFLKSTAEYALWMDSDHILEKPSEGTPDHQAWDEALYKLYRALEESGESIVSGLYRAKQQHGFNYAIWKKAAPEMNKRGYVHVEGWSGNFFEVDVCGLGLTLMRRKVVEELYNQTEYAKKVVEGIKSKCVTELSGVEHLITSEEPFHWETPDSISEDFNFLEKLRRLGYKTWVLSDVRLSHEGRVVINTSGAIRVPMA